MHQGKPLRSVKIVECGEISETKLPETNGEGKAKSVKGKSKRSEPSSSDDTSESCGKRRRKKPLKGTTRKKRRYSSSDSDSSGSSDTDSVSNSTDSDSICDSESISDSSLSDASSSGGRRQKRRLTKRDKGQHLRRKSGGRMRSFRRERISRHKIRRRLDDSSNSGSDSSSPSRSGSAGRKSSHLPVHNSKCWPEVLDSLVLTVDCATPPHTISELDMGLAENSHNMEEGNLEVGMGKFIEADSNSNNSACIYETDLDFSKELMYNAKPYKRR